MNRAADQILEKPFIAASPRITVAPLGARRHYAVPRLLHESGWLEHFYTDSYIGNTSWLERLLKTVPASLRPGVFQRYLGRFDAVLPPKKVKSFEAMGLWYVWELSRCQDFAQRDRVHAMAARRFNRLIVAKGLGDSDVIWGFNGAALELFHSAKQRNIRCILDQTILPKRLELKLLREEIKRWPGWEPGLQIPAEESDLGAREEQEWALADCIVAGSHFVRNGLVDSGVDSRRFCTVKPKNAKPDDGPLKILFAGIVGLRKGVPDLLQALQQLKPEVVQARIAGLITLDRQKLDDLGEEVEFLGHVPRSDMVKLFQWADVFVLPSIVEGSAASTYEALMSGVPVITTPNAGSIVRDGLDGIIVPPRDSRALANAIEYYHENRDILEQHREAAAESIVRVGLDRYRADLDSLMCYLLNRDRQEKR